MLKNLLVYLTHPQVKAWEFQPRNSRKFRMEIPGLQVITCLKSKGFLQWLPEADGVIVWYFKKEWFSLAPRLKLLATPVAGKEWIEMHSTLSDEASGCLKLSFGGFHGSMIAESVVGALLYFCKAFHLSTAMQVQRRWGRVKISQNITSLYGLRVTILGFGNIGREIGRALKPFGCTLTGIKRTSTPLHHPIFQRVTKLS